MEFIQTAKYGDFLKATLACDKPLLTAQWILPSGTKIAWIAQGILQIVPPKLSPKSKDIVLSSGIHGNETAAIEVLDEVARQILLDKWQPKHRLLLIIAHPKAIEAHVREVEENLNRLFGEEQDETTLEQELANRLQWAVRYFFVQSDISPLQQWHLDLHCSIRKATKPFFALSPWSEKPSRGKTLFAFFQQAKLDAVLLSHQKSTSFVSFSANEFGAQSATLELGAVAPFGENDWDTLTPVFNAIQTLICELLPKWQWQQNSDLATYRVSRTIKKDSDDFELNFPDDLPNFTPFEQNALIAKDGLIEYRAEVSGEAVLFPNPSVKMGQRACLLIRPAELIIKEQISIQE